MRAAASLRRTNAALFLLGISSRRSLRPTRAASGNAGANDFDIDRLVNERVCVLLIQPTDDTSGTAPASTPGVTRDGTVFFSTDVDLFGTNPYNSLAVYSQSRGRAAALEQARRERYATGEVFSVSSRRRRRGEQPGEGGGGRSARSEGYW